LHDPHCPAARDMLKVTSLIGDRADRTDDQVETLIAMVRGFRTAAKFLSPFPSADSRSGSGGSPRRP
jgi:hypothetical protein